MRESGRGEMSLCLKMTEMCLSNVDVTEEITWQIMYIGGKKSPKKINK